MRWHPFSGAGSAYRRAYVDAGEYTTQRYAHLARTWPGKRCVFWTAPAPGDSAEPRTKVPATSSLTRVIPGEVAKVWRKPEDGPRSELRSSR